ncbi:MAG: peptidyl-prolyl cis-trans isomerase [Rhodothermales bacterium]
MLGRPLAFFLLVLGLAGCAEEKQPTEFVARLGSAFLLQEDVDRILAALPAAQDSAEAREQIIEQWLTSELLFQEAQRRDLGREEDVRRLLEESERSVLVNALLTTIYEENPVAPTPAELQAYFEQNREQLRTRETFVRIRYLDASTRAEAEEARRILQRTVEAERDSVWIRIIERYASTPQNAEAISANYYPEGRLFAEKPTVRDAIGRLLDDQTAPIIEEDSVFHVIQLVERVPPRTIPRPEWVEDELVRRLAIQARKQLYSRQVQRLRNEALAREDLVVR